jgi:hypothetical protein
MEAGLSNLYSYRPKSSSVIWLIAAFGIGAATCGRLAISDVEGMTLLGTTPVSAGGVRALYWICAIIFLGLAVVAIRACQQRASGRLQIELTQDAILVPTGLMGGQRKRLPYVDITRVTEIQDRGQTFLRIRTGGRGVRLALSEFEGRRQFEEVRAALSRSVR